MNVPAFSRREEANAITCLAFRNGFLEELHAGKWSELLENPNYTRITDAEMKRLMIQASDRVEELLYLKETNPGKYWDQIAWVTENYTNNWVRGGKAIDA